MLGGCGSAGDEGQDVADVDQRDDALAAKCKIAGDPPVTTGCKASQTCLPYACTNSVPPTCYGTCQDAPSADDDRCDVTGDPPVTTGCGKGETCALEACTNSIPPHCWGHCE